VSSRSTLAATTLALTLALAAACGSGDDDTSSKTVHRTTTTTTQAPGTNRDQVRRYVQDLLYRYDQAVNQFVTRPEIASKPDGEVVKQYRSLFPPSTSDVDRALAGWAKSATKGEHYEPFAEGSEVNTSKLDGDLTTISADEVTFPTCDIQSYKHYDRQGKVLDSAERTLVPGKGSAVRVDGTWFLKELDVAEGLIGCATEKGEP
jgi:hypothetical protein